MTKTVKTVNKLNHMAESMPIYIRDNCWNKINLLPEP